MSKPKILPNILMLKFPNIMEIQSSPQWEGVGVVVGGCGKGECSPLCNPIQLIPSMYWAPSPPPPAYIKVCSTQPECIPPSVGFPFLSHSMVGLMSCTKPLPCHLRNNFFAILYKIIGFFNMFHQSYSWHPMFCSLTVFHNQAQKFEFPVTFII